MGLGRQLSPLWILLAWIFSQLMEAYREPGCVWVGSTQTGAWKSQVRACRSPGRRGDHPRGDGARRSRWALLPSLHQEITLLSPQRCPSCPSSDGNVSGEEGAQLPAQTRVPKLLLLTPSQRSDTVLGTHKLGAESGAAEIPTTVHS